MASLSKRPVAIRAYALTGATAKPGGAPNHAAAGGGLTGFNPSKCIGVHSRFFAAEKQKPRIHANQRECVSALRTGLRDLSNDECLPGKAGEYSGYVQTVGVHFHAKAFGGICQSLQKAR